MTPSLRRFNNTKRLKKYKGNIQFLRSWSYQILSTIHDKYVVVPAERVSLNIFLYEKIQWLLNERISIESTQSKLTCTAPTLSKEITENHKSNVFLCPTIQFPIKLRNVVFPTRTCHQSYTDSLTNSVLSHDLSNIFNFWLIKTDRKTYLDTSYARNGINWM